MYSSSALSFSLSVIIVKASLVLLLMLDSGVISPYKLRYTVFYIYCCCYCSFVICISLVLAVVVDSVCFPSGVVGTVGY